MTDDKEPLGPFEQASEYERAAELRREIAQMTEETARQLYWMFVRGVDAASAANALSMLRYLEKPLNFDELGLTAQDVWRQIASWHLRAAAASAERAVNEARGEETELVLATAKVKGLDQLSEALAEAASQGIGPKEVCLLPYGIARSIAGPDGSGEPLIFVAWAGRHRRGQHLPGASLVGRVPDNPDQRREIYIVAEEEPSLEDPALRKVLVDEGFDLDREIAVERGEHGGNEVFWFRQWPANGPM